MLPYQSGKCRLTSGYGYRTHPVTGARNSFHGGIDLVGITTSSGANKLVRAVHAGTVVRSRMVTNKSDATWQWGNYIAITGNDGVTIYYCHLDQRIVFAGQVVKAGDVIGFEGSTGQVTGQHLHFECRRGATQINAADYLGIANVAGTYEDAAPAQEVAAPITNIGAGDKAKIKLGAKYKNGKTVPPDYTGIPYTVSSIQGEYALIKELYSWVPIADLVRV